MSEQNAAPLLVVSPTQEPVEKINSIMSRDGHEVRCAWVKGAREVADMIMQVDPHLLIHVGGARDQLQALSELRNRVAPTLALVVVSESALDEAGIVDLLSAGVHDAVSFAHPDRMRAVLLRELRSYVGRHPHAVREHPRSPAPTVAPDAAPDPAPPDVASDLAPDVAPDPAPHDVASDLAPDVASDLAPDVAPNLAPDVAPNHAQPSPQAQPQTQPRAPRKVSGEICAHVQEGILVEASLGWLESLGLDESILGEPVMDLFEVSSQGALRAALSGTHQGRWRQEPLELDARGGDGTPVRLEITMLPGEHDGEPCVRLVVPSQEAPASADQLSGDPYNAPQPPADAAPSGASPEPSAADPAAAPEDHAPEHADQVPAPEDNAALHADRAPADHAPERAADAQASEDRDPAPANPATGAQLPVAPVTSASSVIPPSPAQPRPAAPRPPGNITTIARDSAATAGMDDRAWLRLLRSALIENRFRLVQQPISSLHGEDPSMFEVLLRLLDPVGREILPEQFEGPAERHDMLKNIDRWVVGASLSFVAQRQPGCLFVRLSADTARDDSFISWIDNQLRVGQAQPERLCFQVPEAIASENLREVREISEALRERGFRFAIESFGTRPESLQLLEHVPVDFVKIDGTLMGSVAHSPQTLQRVRKLVDAAGQRFIMTIGENVQDSDTMAVLWEVGMQYVQASFAEQPLERAGR